MELTIVNEYEVVSKVAVSIHCYRIVPPIEIHEPRFRQHFGIDPGTVNIGLAEYGRNGLITAYQIKMNRHPDPVDRVLNFYTVMSECFHNFISPGFMVIEGSSFRDRYRQTELAEIRTAAIFWARDKHLRTVRIYPPQSIRKDVFGKATIKAHDAYTNIPKDAASAISCVYSSIDLHFFVPNESPIMVKS